MAEEKKERTIVSAVRNQSQEEITTLIGFKRGADTVYEILWFVPDYDEEAQERYNCSLKDLIELGVRALTTRPAYQKVGFDEQGNLLENGHQLMQELADTYRVGQRKASSKSAEQKALENLCKEKGFSLAELIEKAKDL